MANISTSIFGWFTTLFKVWRREFRLIFTDPGVMIFFFALPTLYPVVYTLIYNPEVAREIPVVAVDHSRSVESRNLVRDFNRSEYVNIIGYAANMAEARQAMNEHKCYGIVEVPQDYARRLNTGQQAVVPFYADMSLLIRYRQFSVAIADVQIEEGAKMQLQTLENAGELGALAEPLTRSVNMEADFLGNPTQGFASFIMPGVLVIIIQQSVILGILMLAGTAAERRRRNRGLDPMAVKAGPLITVWGRTLCHIVLYIPLVYFALYMVPWMFRLPQAANFFDVCLLMVPLIIASSMIGQSLGVFMRERESAFILWVYTSVICLFISGLTWPRYAMNGFWQLVGGALPSTWGVQAFVGINSLHSTLAEQSHSYIMLWVLAAVYMVPAAILAWVYRRRLNGAIPAASVAENEPQ